MYAVKHSLILVSTLGLVLTVSASAGFAQDAVLAASKNKTVVDGVVHPGEYSFSSDFGPLALYVNRSGEGLYIGVVGSTAGWVAFGLGSVAMDGATIFMGFLGSDGKAHFKPQAGKDHMHSDVGRDVSDTIVSYAMTKSEGKTTLEVELKPAAYIKKGQTTLDLIFAEGAQPSFTPYHTFRGSLSLKLAQ